MPLASETITLAGSGIVFNNTYGAAVTEAYRGAIITAEHTFQGLFTGSVTLNVDFELQPLSAGFVSQSSFPTVTVSYSSLVAALHAHATTTDDFLAVAGLPTSDPSMGLGFTLPPGEARLLGLSIFTPAVDDTVLLNSKSGFTFGQDAVGAVLHELSEGVFGRIGSLGVNLAWEPLDLFRFTAAGVRDFTGGADGVKTFFGLDATHVTTLAFHNSISAAGVFDGQDLGDWTGVKGDAFGPQGPSTPGSLSGTDLRLLDVLGLTPRTGGTPTADDDVLMGSPGGGDTINGLAGNDTITGFGPASNYLRGGDGDDSIVGGSGFDDINGNKGDDTIDGGVGGDDWLVGGQGNDLITSHAGNDLIYGNLGNDTLIAGSGNDILRGGQGDDSIVAGSGNDFISGDRGNDTIQAGSGADTFHTFAQAGIDKVIGFSEAKGDHVMLDPGTTYTLSQVGGDTVIDMGGGNQMVLVGVQLSTLQPGWIFGA